MKGKVNSIYIAIKKLSLQCIEWKSFDNITKTISLIFIGLVDLNQLLSDSSSDDFIGFSSGCGSYDVIERENTNFKLKYFFRDSSLFANEE